LSWSERARHDAFPSEEIGAGLLGSMLDDLGIDKEEL